MIIHAVLGNPNHPEYGVATIPFPIPHDQYAHCMELLEALEIGDALKADCQVEEIDSFYSVLKRTEKLFVLPQIFFRAFAIAEFLRVRSDKIKVNVIYRCIRHWGIFKIPCAFGIHQLEAFFKIEFLGLVPDAEENIVCLI